MEQNIKQLKEDEKQEVLEEEAKDAKAGKLEIETPVEEETEAAEVVVEKKVSVGPRPEKRFGGRGGRKPRREGGDREASEFEQKIVDLARVTRVMAGGKRMRFRACVAIGDRKGRVAIGLGKGIDVTMAISKAVVKAKKDLVTIPLIRETVPYEIREKYKAARILLKPAPKGTGIIAGGAVRIIFELAGVPNVIAKILGTNNKITNVKATIKALKKFAASDLVKTRIKKQKENKESK